MSDVMTKVCTKCGECKPATTEFWHAKPAGRLGLHSICKGCRSVQSQGWAKRNPYQAREIQRDAKRRIRTTPDGRAHLAAINKRYIERNKEKVNSYYKNKRESDHLFALKARHRGMLSKAFARRGYSKRSRTTDLIGCCWDTLKTHIERQFTTGMSWECFHLIHIDHIIPLATAQTEEDVIRLSHYTNLRPLWAIDNLRKGAKLDYLI